MMEFRAEMFPNPKAVELVEQCAALIAPSVVSLESAKLQSEISVDGYFMRRVMMEYERKIEDEINLYLRDACIKPEGAHWAATPISTDQYRTFSKAVYNRAYEIARPRIDGERELVLGPQRA